MVHRTIHITVIVLILLSFVGLFAQKKDSESFLKDETFSGLKLRNIGPAFMSGRISDIAVHPENNNIWYVAVGSGNVWKTENSGTTWKPIFDDQSSYSIGCVTIDSSNPHVVWVGTGEDVGGRHVAYGDGIYRSQDDGETWENMGLKDSHHISRIIIHPNDSNTLWVTAQGPLWCKGGQRGVYKSVNGGKRWKKVLGDDEWVGATDIVIDPRNPDFLIAATWQRHRNVAKYLGGGPGTALYRSFDGGETWEKLTKGLPESNMGKIGLAISPQNPDVVYAAIELDRRTGGVYRSTNRGASWTKMSDAVAGATGPHYYQELFASPHKFDRLYLVGSRTQVSEDGGKTFRRLNNKNKHVDDHAIAFRADEPDYLIIGSDGGLYESHDLEKRWRYIANLPVTQFYKVAVDDKEPFYTIYGGTQDNSTQGGPSRTDNIHGIRNSDWVIVLGADGHQPATEPGNPDIMYAEWQEGNLTRVDRITGETIFIQPQPEEGEPYERFNWDAPILVSPHSPTRLYYGSQRVWRSDNRGDSWTAISKDLTRNQQRIILPIMDKTWSWDSPWDFVAMSMYNTLTSLAESPQQEGLIYAGTDDGLIQITEDGGTTWRRLEVGSLPGVPKTAFINDIKADLHDANTVYIALDNHKFGDLNPYLLKSSNRGKTWRSIRSNLPNRTLIWRIAQDHVQPNLMFVGTEFGLYFTINGGGQWIKLTGDVPTISFRDLAIQRRENDLVGATFGRGFFIFDDYSVLRQISDANLKKPFLVSPRKAWWYIPQSPLGGSDKGSQGDNLYTAPNPPFGAVFTYYLPEGLETRKSIRQEEEKELSEKNQGIPFPGWDAVEAERREEEPKVILTIRDVDGNVVRRVTGPAPKGFHRVAWDLRYPSTSAMEDEIKKDSREPRGVMAAPGSYTVQLSQCVNGKIINISKPLPFKVERLRKGALEGSTPQETATFWKKVAALQRQTSAASMALREALSRVDVLKVVLSRITQVPGELDQELHELRKTLLQLDEQLNGNRSKRQVGEGYGPTINHRLRVARSGTFSSTYGPTPTHRQSLEIAAKQFIPFKKDLETVISHTLPLFEKKLQDAGAPWIPGQPLPEN